MKRFCLSMVYNSDASSIAFGQGPKVLDRFTSPPSKIKSESCFHLASTRSRVVDLIDSSTLSLSVRLFSTFCDDCHHSASKTLGTLRFKTRRMDAIRKSSSSRDRNFR
mmetsp:Transcript_35946/g.80828  ORF Transcript_35946/g.80828 Transcript_35946/m.80828 type:complete len:108 (+) Transcript_35946:279-602(+)